MSYVQSTLALRTPRYYAHPANIRTAAKSPSENFYRRLTEIIFRYYGLFQQLAVPRVSAITGVDCIDHLTY